MWFFISREALPFPKRCQLISKNRMRQGPDGVMHADPAFKHEEDPVAKSDVFQGSNRSPRVPNKLRKEHRQTICSSSGRSRIASPKRDSNSLPIRPSSISNNTTLTSTLQQKVPELSAEWQREPTMMLESGGAKAQNLPKPPKARNRTSKLQKKSGNDLTQKKPQKKKSENHSKKARAKEMPTIYGSTQYTVAITAEVQPARLKKRKRKSARSVGKHTYGNSSLTSLDINLSPRCSLSGPSDITTAYVLSTLDALSARPTIKYKTKPRYEPQPSYIGDLENEGQRCRRTISEADLMASKRVDRLADCLSARELRELMERDQKRKEKKRIVELARMEKRLNRWTETQTEVRVTGSHESPVEDEPNTFTQRSPLVQNMSEPIFNQKQENKAYLVAPKEKHTSSSSKAETSVNRLSDLITQNPSIDEPGLNKITPTSTPKPIDPADEISPTKKVKKTRLSQYMALRLSTYSAASSLPVDEVSKSHSKPLQSWSIFKLSNKKKRESVPPSFSTTSRVSLPSGKPPHFYHTPMRSASSFPKRTVSKFREDLPELPISPKSSKILSSFETPELQEKTSKSRIIDPSLEVNQTHNDTITTDQNYFNYKSSADGVSNSGHMIGIKNPPRSKSLSQSLRSIESEVSWLSNGKRQLQNGSKKAQKHFKSKSFLKSDKHQRYSAHAIEKQLNFSDKDFSRRSTDNSEVYAQSSIESGEEASCKDKKWGAVARQPQVVHSSSAAHRSRYGILNEIETEVEADSYSVSLETSTTESEEDPSY